MPRSKIEFIDAFVPCKIAYQFDDVTKGEPHVAQSQLCLTTVTASTKEEAIRLLCIKAGLRLKEVKPTTED